MIKKVAVEKYNLVSPKTICPNKLLWPGQIVVVVLLLVTVVEGDPKAPFSITITSRCKGGRYSFPWIDPLYL